VDVSPASSVLLTFDEPMNPSTLTSDTMALYANGAVIRPSVSRSADGTQVTLTASLPANSVVSVVATDDVQDLSGNPLPPFVSSFVTGPAPSVDGTRPSVTATLPGNGSTGWIGLDEVTFYVSEALDPATVPAAFHLAQNGVLVSGTVSVLGDNRTIRFKADAPFADGAYMQFYLESLAQDAAGNAVYDYSGYFYMGAGGAQAGVRPYPTAFYPGNSMTGVALNPVIYTSYTEEMDASSLTTANVRLFDYTGGNVLVPIDFELDGTGRILKVSPQSPLQPNRQYYLYLSSTIEDTDGDAQIYDYSSWFTTGGDVIDDRQPMVVAMSPFDGSAAVGVNAGYAVRYDESMNPVSFNADGNRYGATFSENNQVVRYNRFETLPPSAEVTEPAPTLVDASGNTVVAASATFTTGTGPDFTAPTATYATVVNNQQGVALNPVLEFVFDEALDPVSVNTSTVAVAGWPTHHPRAEPTPRHGSPVQLLRLSGAGSERQCQV